MYPIHQSLVLQGFLLMCCMYTTVVVEPSVQAFAMALFVWYKAGFSPCVINGSVLGHLGLEWCQTWNIPELWLHQTAKCSSCVVPWLSLWVGPAVKPDVCPRPQLELQSNCCAWLSFPLPRAEVTLDWYWPLSGLFAQCHICGPILDVVMSRSGWRGLVHRKV